MPRAFVGIVETALHGKDSEEKNKECQARQNATCQMKFLKLIKK